MKLNIDLAKLAKKSLNINQYLLLLKVYYQSRHFNLDFVESKPDYFYLKDSGFLTIDGSNVSLNEKAIVLIENNIGDRNYDELANKIKEVFPKGAKSGKWPWRSTTKDLADRLKKLDKNHGLDDYDDDIIVKTAQSYVNRFTVRDMDSGMQVCKYFIEKDGSSSLVDLLLMGEDDNKSNSISRMIKL